MTARLSDEELDEIVADSRPDSMTMCRISDVKLVSMATELKELRAHYESHCADCDNNALDCACRGKSMITREDLEARIAIAKTTPREWRPSREPVRRGQYSRRINGNGFVVCDIAVVCFDHVFANHPQAVIELCEELLAAREEIARLCKYMERHGIEKCLHPDGAQRRRDDCGAEVTGSECRHEFKRGKMTGILGKCQLCGAKP